ncbi:MAG: hypothetical protein C0490_27320 [Marivirga sp.]|nr:hypothetical protein [Marivirga sp.]
MDWMYHGGRGEADLKALTNTASVIFVASIKLIQKLPVAYSSGDGRIPVIWEMNTLLISGKSLERENNYTNTMARTACGFIYRLYKLKN